MAYKVFTNGSVLNASEINDNLMNQSVMVFSNSAARTAAITTPLEGMLTWLEDSNKYQNYNGSAWVDLGAGKILQVLSTTKTDTFTTTSTSFTDVTGLSVTITPSSASSKIYITGSIKIASNGTATNAVFMRLLRNSTAIALGDAAGSRIPSYTGTGTSAASMDAAALDFLDSPATTSAVTYKIQLQTNVAGTVALNRWVDDIDGVSRPRGVSVITVMEVAG